MTLLQCKDDKGLLKLFLTDHTKKAYEQIRKAADEGNAIALYMMAEYFSEGYGVQHINQQKAIAYFKKSYEAGYPVAGYDVAASLPDGSPEQDEIRNHAKDNILELANEGDACAQNNLGAMYYYGHGVEQSYEKATEWYLKAAEQGLADAQCNLGLMYEYGTGVEQSDEKAAEWVLKAAKQGFADAQNHLGWMYEDGTGVEQSYEKAVEWYLKAAEQGLADAQYNLGEMYALGDGVEQSNEKAREWLQKAADQGFDCAMFGLYDRW